MANFVKFCVIINGITTLDVEINSTTVQYINLRNFLKEDKKQKPVCVACLPSLCWRHSLAWCLRCSDWCSCSPLMTWGATYRKHIPEVPDDTAVSSSPSTPVLSKSLSCRNVHMDGYDKDTHKFQCRIYILSLALIKQL